jgi:hypothetical protein
MPTVCCPPTPEFSPTTTDAAPFQPFPVGETDRELDPEPELELELGELDHDHEPKPKPKKLKTIALCFDGTGNKFGDCWLIHP